MSNVKVREINVLAVYVSDLEKEKTFYIEQLGSIDPDGNLIEIAGKP